MANKPFQSNISGFIAGAGNVQYPAVSVTSEVATRAWVESNFVTKSTPPYRHVRYLGRAMDEEAMLEYSDAQPGDFCYRYDTLGYWVLGDTPPTTVDNWKNFNPLRIPSVTTTTGAISLKSTTGNLYKASISEPKNFVLTPGSSSVISAIVGLYEFYLEIENTSANSVPVTFGFCSGWFGDAVSTVAAGKVVKIVFETTDSGSAFYGRVLGVR